jgi:Zn-dependent peptidase ImmA (M78 family)
VVNKLQSEVENSARQTLLTLVKSLGVEKVAIDFSQSKIVPSTVQTNELEANMQKAKNKIKSLVSKKEE